MKTTFDLIKENINKKKENINSKNFPYNNNNYSLEKSTKIKNNLFQLVSHDLLSNNNDSFVLTIIKKESEIITVGSKKNSEESKVTRSIFSCGEDRSSIKTEGSCGEIFEEIELNNYENENKSHKKENIDNDKSDNDDNESSLSMICEEEEIIEG